MITLAKNYLVPAPTSGAGAARELLPAGRTTRALTVRTAVMTDRIAAGRAVYARNLGVDPAEAERVLTDRDRGIAIIAALVCQNVTDRRLLTYLSLARRNGVDQQGLTALMVLLTAYVGQPYTSLAMETVRRSADLS